MDVIGTLPKKRWADADQIREIYNKGGEIILQRQQIGGKYLTHVLLDGVVYVHASKRKILLDLETDPRLS